MDNCPVCNHKVEDKDYSGVVDGIVYYFCCRKCEKNFEFEPRKFINCCEQKKGEIRMKSKLIILSAVALIFSASQVFAEGGHDHGDHGEEVIKEEKGSMMDEHHFELPNVGNKICPVSGEAIGSMGEGFQVEHEGKVYNLCCAMCAKDFKKDPAKYSKVTEEEAAKEQEGK